MPRVGYTLLLLVLASCLVAVAHAATPDYASRTTIRIGPDGVVHVTMSVYVERGVNAIQLPAQPIPGTIIVEVDGRALPPIYVNNTLYVFSPVSGNATIDYVVNVTLQDGVYYFIVRGEADLVVPPGIVLLTVPNVTAVHQEDGKLVFHIIGTNLVKYVVAMRKTATTTPAKTVGTQTLTQTLTTTTPTGSARVEESVGTAGQATRTTPRTTSPSLFLPAASLAIIALLAATLLLILRRSRSGSPASSSHGSSQPPGGGLQLSDTDKLVLEKLRELGGKALQSELQRATGLPKTTLWRAVKRLEKAGFVRVYKDSQGRNVVVLSE